MRWKRAMNRVGLGHVLWGIAVGAVALAAVPAASQASGKVDEGASKQSQARESEASAIGVKAYIYGKPVVEMYKTRYELALNTSNPKYTPLNQFNHFRQLVGPEFTAVVSPNNDTLYSTAWLDLTREPIVLHVPNTHGRYYTMQMMDFYTNNFAYVGKRTTGTEEGTFAIVGPGFRGALPNRVARIEAPTPYVWIIGRTLVDGPEDLPAVHTIQDQYTLTPLGQWGKRPDSSSAADAVQLPPFDESGPLTFFRMMNLAIRQNPPPTDEVTLMRLFDQIGVGPSREFVIDELDPAVASDLQRAWKIGQQTVTAKTAELGTRVNGWDMLPPDVGRYGHNYLLRAAVAQKGLGANSPEEAVYPIANVDEQGASLSGTHQYTLRFEKGQTPPVDAFWSVTMYRLPEYLLVDNPIERYSIGNRTAGLQFGTDGSLEIYLQHDPPKDKRSNWLPAPDGPFYVILRIYMPKQAVLDGTYRVPPIRRAQAAADTAGRVVELTKGR